MKEFWTEVSDHDLCAAPSKVHWLLIFRELWKGLRSEEPGSEGSRILSSSPCCPAVPEGSSASRWPPVYLNPLSFSFLFCKQESLLWPPILKLISPHCMPYMDLVTTCLMTLILPLTFITNLLSGQVTGPSCTQWDCPQRRLGDSGHSLCLH